MPIHVDVDVGSMAVRDVRPGIDKHVGIYIEKRHFQNLFGW